MFKLIFEQKSVLYIHFVQIWIFCFNWYKFDSVVACCSTDIIDMSCYILLFKINIIIFVFLQRNCIHSVHGASYWSFVKPSLICFCQSLYSNFLVLLQQIYLQNHQILTVKRTHSVCCKYFEVSNTPWCYFQHLKP